MWCPGAPGGPLSCLASPFKRLALVSVGFTVQLFHLQLRRYLVALSSQAFALPTKHLIHEAHAESACACPLRDSNASCGERRAGEWLFVLGRRIR